MSTQKVSHSATKSLVAGAVGGVFEGLVCYPIEYVKTQLQLSKKGYYSGPIDCAKQIIRTNGVGGLYNGVNTLVTGCLLKAATRFATYDTIKNVIVGDKKATPMISVVCGLSAGVVEAIVAVTPSESIKTRIIDDSNKAVSKYRGSMVTCIKLTLKEEGMAGLYSGLTATILKQGLNQASRFFVYNLLMDNMVTKDPKTGNKFQLLGNSTSLISGGLSGATSVYITQPFDTTKTRMQGLDAHKYKSTFDCMKQIYQHEGVRAFWSGTVPRLARVASSSSIVFFCYENVMKFLNTNEFTKKHL